MALRSKISSGCASISRGKRRLRLLTSASLLVAALVVAWEGGTANAVPSPFYAQFTANDGRVLKLLVYPGPTSQSPVVFAVHGGGFSTGTVEIAGTETCAPLVAALPVACIAPEYRLDSPVPRVLRQARDVANAIASVRDRAPMFGIDPDRVAVHGRSAGGTLALLSNSIWGVPVRAIIDESGPTDFVQLQKDGTQYRATVDTLVRLAVGCTDDSDACVFKKRNHSPVMWARRTTAPTLIVHSDPESISRLQGERLQKVLNSVGVPNELVIHADSPHAYCDKNLDRDWLQAYLLT